MTTRYHGVYKKRISKKNRQYNDHKVADQVHKAMLVKYTKPHHKYQNNTTFNNNVKAKYIIRGK